MLPSCEKAAKVIFGGFLISTIVHIPHNLKNFFWEFALDVFNTDRVRP